MEQQNQAVLSEADRWVICTNLRSPIYNLTYKQVKERIPLDPLLAASVPPGFEDLQVVLLGRGRISGNSYIKGGSHLDLFIGDDAVLKASSDYMKIGPLAFLNADLSAFRTTNGELRYQLIPNQGIGQHDSKSYTAEELLAKVQSYGERADSVTHAVAFIEKTFPRES